MAAKMKKVLSNKEPSSGKSEALLGEIRKKAYCIWQEEGSPQGKDWDIWLKAERDVVATLNKG